MKEKGKRTPVSHRRSFLYKKTPGLWPGVKEEMDRRWLLRWGGLCRLLAPQYLVETGLTFPAPVVAVASAEPQFLRIADLFGIALFAASAARHHSHRFLARMDVRLLISSRSRR